MALFREMARKLGIKRNLLREAKPVVPEVSRKAYRRLVKRLADHGVATVTWNPKTRTARVWAPEKYSRMQGVGRAVGTLKRKGEGV